VKHIRYFCSVEKSEIENITGLATDNPVYIDRYENKSAGK
jgi:hypothetical protein